MEKNWDKNPRVFPVSNSFLRKKIRNLDCRLELQYFPRISKDGVTCFYTTTFGETYLFRSLIGMHKFFRI